MTQGDLMAQAERDRVAPEWAVELDRIRAGCQVDNWDSYGGDPVTEVALHVTDHLLRSMHLSPTADGGIEVFFAGEALSFRLGPDGLLDEMYGSRTEMMRWLKPRAGDSRD